MTAPAALLDAARSGDASAFEQLVAPYRAELQAYCYRMLGSLHDAEDVLQETLLKAWRSLESFERRASVHTWLYSERQAFSSVSCSTSSARSEEHTSELQ